MKKCVTLTPFLYTALHHVNAATANTAEAAKYTHLKQDQGA